MRAIISLNECNFTRNARPASNVQICTHELIEAQLSTNSSRETSIISTKASLMGTRKCDAKYQMDYLLIFHYHAHIRIGHKKCCVLSHAIHFDYIGVSFNEIGFWVA